MLGSQYKLHHTNVQNEQGFFVFLHWFRHGLERGCITNHQTLIFMCFCCCDLCPFQVPNILPTSFAIIIKLMMFMVFFYFTFSYVGY
jgi:hypothetical protein